MTEDRLMVVQAVFEGVIGEEYLTTAEVDEMFMLVAEVAFQKEMDDAIDRGCSVFAGFEEDLIH